MLCAGATKLCGASGGSRRRMDAFSEVLNGVRLKGAMFFRAEFSAPWRLSTPHCRALAPTLAPGAPHMLIYHFVVDGSARVCLEGESDVELSPGDIVLFPHGDPHRLSGGSGSNQIDGAALLRKVATRDLSPMRAGGGGATTAVRVWVLDVRPAPLRSDSRELAAHAEGEHQDRPLRAVAGAVDPASRRGGRLGRRRQRRDARQAVGSPVRGHDEAIRHGPPRSDDRVARGRTRPCRGQEPRAASQPPESPVDHCRARHGRRPVSLRARGAFHALPLGSPYRVFDGLAAASGGPGVDVDPEGSGGYRGRRGLRV